MTLNALLTTMVVGLGWGAVITALAPLFSGLRSSFRTRLAGRAGAGVAAHYRELLRLLIADSSTHQAAGAGRALMPSLALAAMVAAVTLLPHLTVPSTQVGASCAFVALLALSRFAILVGALQPGAARAARAVARQVPQVAQTEAALLLALCTLSILPQVEPGRTSAYLLATVGFALAVFHRGAAAPTRDASARNESEDEALLASYSGIGLGMVRLSAAVRDLLLWTTWGLVFWRLDPTTSLGLVMLIALLVAMAGACAHADFATRRLAFRVADTPSTALGLATGALLIAILTAGGWS